jgi:hypothetical protein
MAELQTSPSAEQSLEQHRTELTGYCYRAAEWRHKEVELAAHDLLQRLDEKSG